MESETKNSCYTYFRIVGEFDPDEISEILQLTPEEQWKIGDYRKNGTQYECASWIIGTCTEYDIAIENQMRKTIAPLLDKTDLLKKIHDSYDVSFWLEVVPYIYLGESTPCLAPSLDIIDFCHETRTEIDIDYYIMEDDEEEEDEKEEGLLTCFRGDATLFHTSHSQEDGKAFGGSALIELSFCKLKPWTSIKKIVAVRSITFWQDDSLYFADVETFCRDYSNIFDCGIYNNLKTGPVDLTGINYYKPDLIDAIIMKVLENKPTDYEILIAWLNKAKKYNGFYILGI